MEGEESDRKSNFQERRKEREAKGSYWDKKEVKQPLVKWEEDTSQQYQWWLLPLGLPAALSMPPVPTAHQRAQPPAPAACDQLKWTVGTCVRRKRSRKQCAEKGEGTEQGPLLCILSAQVHFRRLLFHVPHPTPTHTPRFDLMKKPSVVGGSWPSQGTCPTGLGAGGLM